MNFILKLISLSTNKSIYQLDELAYLLDVSNSTLRQNIKRINSLQVGIHFESIKGVGYKIIVSDIDTALEYSNRDYGLEFLTTRQKIIVQFSKTNDYIKITKLCEDLFISRTKLEKEIKYINEELCQGIKIDYIPYKGYKLIGDELLIRSYLLNNLQGFDSLQLLNIKIFEYLEQYEQAECSRNDINNFCKAIILSINRDGFLSNFDYTHNFNLLKFLNLNISQNENMYITYAFDYYILKKKPINYNLEYNKNITLLQDLIKIYQLPTDEIIKSLANTIAINDYYNELVIYDNNNYNFINYLLNKKLKSNNKNLDLSRLDVSLMELYRRSISSTFKKILLIRGQNKLDDQGISTYIKMIFPNTEVNSISLYKTLEIIEYKPDLIVITDAIDGDILSKYITTRRINLNSNFQNSQINIRNYILDYNLLKIYRNKVTFTDQIFPSETLFQKKDLSINITKSSNQIFNINIDDRNITISESFYSTDIEHLLTANKIVDLFLNNFLYNKSENEIRLFIDHSFKC